MTRSPAVRQKAAASTIFEQVWEQPDGHIFISRRHGIMAVADAFPKLPLQVVIAPRYGSVGNDVRFSGLPRPLKRRLHEVADAVEEKINEAAEPGQRAITHTEGFGVPDHAHILLYAAERRQGEQLYTGEPLGDLAVRHTLEVITFTPVEAQLLEARLDQLL